MMKEIEKKVDKDGKYKAESIYRSWKGWDFNQKKEPSAGFASVDAPRSG